MTVSAILQRKGREVISIGSHAAVSDAVALLAERRIGAIPVIDGGEVVGVFSERDVVYCLASKGAAALALRVAEVMTAPAVTVDSESPVLAALSLMTRRRIRHLPVIDAGRIAGFISIGDLVKFRIDHIETEASAMREYIQGA